jgi:4-hydroxythreonine-4-phosphate dehydrogenase
MQQQGLRVTGPHPADGFFAFGAYKNYDGILAMYHDQGLIPLKLLAHGAGVNVTAGLSIVRTSPDHGTAYDRALSSDIDSASTQLALEMAIR